MTRYLRLCVCIVGLALAACGVSPAAPTRPGQETPVATETSTPDTPTPTPTLEAPPSPTATPAAFAFMPMLSRAASPMPPYPTFTPTPTTVPSPTPTPFFDPAVTTIRLEPVVSGLSSPVGIASAGDGTGRLFALEKVGLVRIIRNGQLIFQPFLDIRSEVGSVEFEQGLLGIAFHPRYRENGYFFVNYTNRAGDTVIARYRVSANPDRADVSSAKVILTIDQPFDNHNGGHLAFGPDGYLYIGTGDGGDGGDPRGYGQSPSTRLGKMLRIDIDQGDPYRVPSDNPFVNDARYRPEIWAVGLRNPWRYSFDRRTGDLFIADVGQGDWEEVSWQPASSRGGENYGWNRMEGAHCYPPGRQCDTTGLVLPIGEYNHDLGCSVTGGYVYRGSRYPTLYGAYLFADFCSGRFWSLHRAANGQWVQTLLLDSAIWVSAFGEDDAGEVYVLDMTQGGVYRIVAAAR